jgi:Chaperone of endosialidase
MKIKTFIFLLLLSGNYIFAQVGIGTTNPQAALEIRSTTDGLLIPRVALSATNVATIATPTISELVYNTNTTVNGTNRVSPGFYYWSGTNWIRLITSNQPSNDWSLSGNTSTNANFIGTTNDANLIFKRNNVYAGSIGQDNVVLGVDGLDINSNDFRCVAIGAKASRLSTNCFDNIAIGYSTLENSITSTQNTAVGSFSLQSNTIGYQNCALGAATLIANTEGFRNIAIGNAALNSNTTGNNNIAIGGQSLQLNTTGNSNSSFGERSMFNATTSTLNVAMGFRALSNTTIGSRNTAVGSQAMLSNSIGNNNTAVGYNAMALATGTNNTAIGYNTTLPTNNASNQVRIGNNAVTYAGAQVAWSVTSDRRWKEDIKKSNLGLDFINQLNPVSYIRKSEDTETTKQKREYGFIAQELEQILISNNAKDNGIITKDDEGMLSVRYNDLLAPMVRAIQELNEKNKNQEKLIQELVTRLETLEKK